VFQAALPGKPWRDLSPAAQYSTALPEGDGPLWVSEGAFNALALLATRVARVVAIFGVHGWQWDWVQHVRAGVGA
jgi:hypothetical protein